jgi:hypothetical protein
LDFSRATRLVTDEMIHAALRCARGQLRLLDTTSIQVPFEALLGIARANAALHMLRLYLGAFLNVTQIHSLLAAAPRLQTLQCGVTGEPQEMLPLLRKELPTYGALRLTVVNISESEENALVEVDVLPLAAAAAAHEGLQSLGFYFIPLSVAQLTAVVDAAVQRQMTSVEFFRCSLGPEHLPQLTRLLASPCLRILDVDSDAQPLIVGAGVPAFCAALRASNLRDVSLSGMRLFHSLPDGLAVLDALTGHRSIEKLDLFSNTSPSPEAEWAIGQALSRLLAAESALTSLGVGDCILGDAGFSPLFTALAQNMTLRSLLLPGHAISRECARDVILPAVRANTSLRNLEFDEPDFPELVEAEQLVCDRYLAER